MIDQQGTFLSHPDQTNILKKNIRDEAEMASLAQKMIEQEKTSVAYTHHGTSKVTGVCPIPLTGWSIGATPHKKEIMGLAYANMRFLLLVSIFFIVLITLAVISREADKMAPPMHWMQPSPRSSTKPAT